MENVERNLETLDRLETDTWKRLNTVRNPGTVVIRDVKLALNIIKLCRDIRSSMDNGQ